MISDLKTNDLQRLGRSWEILAVHVGHATKFIHAVQCSETLHQKKANFDNLFCKSTLKIVYKAFIKNSELCFLNTKDG